MACRIRKVTFQVMAKQEADSLGLRYLVVDQRDPLDRFEMAEVRLEEAVLNRKAIQSLVDEAEQARVIIRNLLRWAKEHGAK